MNRWDCERSRPLQGSIGRQNTPQNREKRVSGSKKLPFPIFELKKSPFLDWVPQGKWGFFNSKLLIWPSEFWENCLRISQRILMANSIRKFFRPCFSRASLNQAPPPPKIHAQTCWHSSPISLSRTQSFINANFLLTAETNIS